RSGGFPPPLPARAFGARSGAFPLPSRGGFIPTRDAWGRRARSGARRIRIDEARRIRIMTPCLRCGRPLAARLPRCVYCGADAPPAAAEAPPEVPPEPSPRLLVLAQTGDADPVALARALGLAAADAAHRVRRGGWQLLRIAE